MSRKELRRMGRRNLKRHYVIFAVICLIVAFFGAEYNYTLRAFTYTADRLGGTERLFSSGISLTPHVNYGDLLDQVLDQGEIDAGALQEQVKEHEAKAALQETGTFARSRGVLAMVVNKLSSGYFLVGAVTILTSTFRARSWVVVILAILSEMTVVFVWILIRNSMTAVSRRIFLEGRVYRRLPARRALFFAQARRWLRMSATLFVTSLFKTLWGFTIVGGFIKRYSYELVPYLVAENPSLKPLEAIRLSRQMMKGHKWKRFLLGMSFAGWEMLGSLTLGVLNVLYITPYEIATFTEFYAAVRKEYLAEHPEEAVRLDDKYLFEKATPGELALRYRDVLERSAEVGPVPALSGVRGFLARNFGVLIRWGKTEQTFERASAGQDALRGGMEAARGDVYPMRLFPGKGRLRPETSGGLRYRRCYTIWSLIAMFFIFSFMGWAWEVGFHLVTDHAFVNRGVLHGPWLPIYGCGGLMIVIFLRRLRGKPLVEFVVSMVMCGVVEYCTALVLELIHDGEKWWDYTGYFLNIQGRVCAEGLLVFGVAGLLASYIVAPILDELLRKVSRKVLIPICLVLVLGFGGDLIRSAIHPNTGVGITDFSQEWERVHGEEGGETGP